MLHTSTQIRVDGTTGRGTGDRYRSGISASEDSDRFRVDGYWRFADRHKLRVLYFDRATTPPGRSTATSSVGDTSFPVRT